MTKHFWWKLQPINKKFIWECIKKTREIRKWQQLDRIWIWVTGTNPRNRDIRYKQPLSPNSGKQVYSRKFYKLCFTKRDFPCGPLQFDSSEILACPCTEPKILHQTCNLQVNIIRSVIEHAFHVLDTNDEGRLSVDRVCEALLIENLPEMTAFFAKFASKFEPRKLKSEHASKRQLSQRLNSQINQLRPKINKSCFVHFVQKLIEIQSPSQNQKMLANLGYNPKTLFAESKRKFNMSIHSKSEVESSVNKRCDLKLPKFALVPKKF